ncbi:MAG: XRE family transcriptional regulator [Ignavibacteriae bacterium]|nr:MAG: XRE family transcriptional regulator [Ignavibacteriota bacterium]
MNDINEMNDSAILDLLGKRVKKERLNQNMTQTELVQRAGINRTVLTRLENGKGCTLSSLVRLLRSLGKINQLDLFLPEPGVSPIQLSRLTGQQRQEASGMRGRRPEKVK